MCVCMFIEFGLALCCCFDDSFLAVVVGLIQVIKMFVAYGLVAMCSCPVLFCVLGF